MVDVQQLTGSNQLRGETQTHRARHFQYRKQSLSLVAVPAGQQRQNSQFWTATAGQLNNWFSLIVWEICDLVSWRRVRCEDICCHGSAESNILRRRHGNIDREGNEGARHNKSQRVADLLALMSVAFITRVMKYLVIGNN